MQQELSMWQARWMEYLSQYDYTLNYISGELNTVADALSCYPDWPSPLVDAAASPCPPLSINAIFEVNSDPSFLDDIWKGYDHDPWCIHIVNNFKAGKLDTKFDISIKDGHLFIKNWLVIPRYKCLREQIFHLTHDNLGHFGKDKTYANIHHKFFWPYMRHDLVDRYISSCIECQ